MDSKEDIFFLIITNVRDFRASLKQGHHVFYKILINNFYKNMTR